MIEKFSSDLGGGDQRSGGHLVDLNTGTLRHNHILIQQTPGVELFIGLGPIAGRALDFAFDGKTGSDPFLATCEVIDHALASGDLAKIREFGANDALADISDPQLRRLVLLDAMLAKASPDDPIRPGWPAGTPGSRGGQFRPKDDSAVGGGETTEQRVKRLAARTALKIAASTALQLAVTAALNFVPGEGIVADVAEVIELAKTAIELGNLVHEVNATVDFVKGGPYDFDDLRASPSDESLVRSRKSRLLSKLSLSNSAMPSSAMSIITSSSKAVRMKTISQPSKSKAPRTLFRFRKCSTSWSMPNILRYPRKTRPRLSASGSRPSPLMCSGSLAWISYKDLASSRNDNPVARKEVA